MAELFQRIAYFDDESAEAGPFDWFIYSNELGGIEKWFDNETEARETFAALQEGTSDVEG